MIKEENVSFVRIKFFFQFFSALGLRSLLLSRKQKCGLGWIWWKGRKRWGKKIKERRWMEKLTSNEWRNNQNCQLIFNLTAAATSILRPLFRRCFQIKQSRPENLTLFWKFWKYLPCLFYFFHVWRWLVDLWNCSTCPTIFKYF